MQSPNVRYVAGIDHLRAFAALLIFFYHAVQRLSLIPRAGSWEFLGLWIRSWNPFVVLVAEGHTAVSLFMVLSGFIFTLGAHGQDVVYGAFVRNRLLRIYPMYLVMIMIGLASFPSAFNFVGLLQSLLLMGNMPGSLDVLGFGAMFWAVAIELQFYLVFPFLHRFLERDGLRYGLALLVLMPLLRVFAQAAGTTNARDISYWYLLGRLDQFVLGMLAARAFVHLRERKLPWGALCALACSTTLCVLVAFNQAGGWPSTAGWKVLWPLAEGLVWSSVLITYVPFSARFPGWFSRPIAKLGTYSYSFYLFHFVALETAPKLVPYALGAHPNLHAMGYAALNVLPALAALSALTFYTVERPFLALRVRYLRPFSDARSAE